MSTMRVQFYADPAVRPEGAGCRIALEWRLMVMIGTRVSDDQPGYRHGVAVRAATLTDIEAHPAEYRAYLAGDEPGETPAAAPRSDPEGEALFGEIIALNRRLVEVNRGIAAAPFQSPAAYRERVQLFDDYVAAHATFDEYLSRAGATKSAPTSTVALDGP